MRPCLLLAHSCCCEPTKFNRQGHQILVQLYLHRIYLASVSSFGLIMHRAAYRCITSLNVIPITVSHPLVHTICKLNQIYIHFQYPLVYTIHSQIHNNYLNWWLKHHKFIIITIRQLPKAILHGLHTVKGKETLDLTS